MKNVLVKKIDIVPATFVFCTTDKARLKYLERNHNWTNIEERQRQSEGITHVLKEDGYLTLIVGIVIENNIGRIGFVKI